MLHKHTNEWIGLRERKGVYVFDGWVSPAMTAGRKKLEFFSLTLNEHNVDVAPCGFSQGRESSVRPQNQGQPMNPDDLQASEEVGNEEAIPAKALPSPTQTTRKERQKNVLTYSPLDRGVGTV